MAATGLDLAYALGHVLRLSLGLSETQNNNLAISFACLARDRRNPQTRHYAALTSPTVTPMGSDSGGFTRSPR